MGEGMTYATEFDRLARALAEVISRAPNDWDTDLTPRASVFASRDVVVARLRIMTEVLVDASPARGHRSFLARHVSANPGHALHAALAELPSALSEGRSGADRLLLTEVSHTDTPWRRAAQACLYLEPYTEALRTLPGEQGWAALRQIADAASAVLLIDEDLTIHLGAEHVDVGRHGALRIAIHEVRAHVSDTEAAPTLTLPPSVAPRVRSIADLPGATRQLSRLLIARGADVTAVEVRSAARVVTEGLDITARAIAGTPGPEARQLAKVLRDAAAQTRALYCTPMATLTPPSMPVRYLAGELSNRLRAVDGLLDRLDADPTSRSADRAEIVNALLPWVGEAGALCATTDRVVNASQKAARLLEPARGTTTYEWLPAASRTAGSDSVAASRRATAAAVLAARLADQAGAPHARPQTPTGQSELLSAVDARRRMAVRSRAEHPAHRLTSRPVERSEPR